MFVMGMVAGAVIALVFIYRLGARRIAARTGQPVAIQFSPAALAKDLPNDGLTPMIMRHDWQDRAH